MPEHISHELEVKVPASQAWDLYSTHKLGKLAQEQFKGSVKKVEFLEGDGGLGTVVKLVFPPPGLAGGITSYKEKITKIDGEKRVKETEVVEGGYLDVGFTLYRVRFEIIEKGGDACIIKSSIEYDIKKEAAANGSIVDIQPLVKLAEIAKAHLTKNKAS